VKAVGALLTGHGALVPALALTVVAALIFVVTARLARHADAIAQQTGLGRLWVGTMLLAASTSLPELLTNVNAGLLGEPDIGAGDLLGASLANMLILAGLDVALPRHRILQRIVMTHTLVGLLGVALALVTAVALLTGGWGRLGHVGLESGALVAVYLAGAALVYRITVRGRSEAAAPSVPVLPQRAPLRTATIGFGAGTAALLVLAPLLVLSAGALATESGLSEAFVGTLLVGLTTALPELAATLSAVRIGALDLAAGNVFGSVAFNLVMLALLDVAYVEGPLVGALARDHLLTILLLVGCLALAMLGMASRTRRARPPVLVESVLIIVLYVAGAWLLARGLS
jgi:cation:H+ antiporter